MRENDPRPMPPQVLTAYRSPVDLSALFASRAFTDADRFAVRDQLLDRLIAKYGNVEVEQRGKYLPIRKRLASFKKNAWGSIEIILRVEDYGGRDAVLLELATVMQPYWSRWWESNSFFSDIYAFDEVAAKVLGDKQLRWISAQLARVALPRVLSRNVDVCIAAIEAAERYCISLSVYSLMDMSSAYSRADEAAVLRTPISNARAYQATYAAMSAAKGASVSVSRTMMYALGSFAPSEYVYKPTGEDAKEASASLNKVVRDLITPTLITSASRGLQ